MKTASRVSLIATLTLLAWGSISCKSTSESTEKSLSLTPETTLDITAWTKACKEELANPATGASSRQDLKKLAGTDDCAAAYPTVKQIVESYTRKS